MSRRIAAVVATVFASWACGGGFTTSSQDDPEGSSSGGELSSSSGEIPNVSNETDASTPSDNDASSSSSGDPGPGPTSQCPYSADANGFFTLQSAAGPYTVRLPPSYDANTPARLLVAIKGCGDNAANFATWAAVPWSMRTTQDYIAISVGGRDGECWEVPGDASLVKAAIEHVRSCFAVHQKKIVIGGYDSGARLAYATAFEDASQYAGVLIEHASLTSTVGSRNVDRTLADAAWKLPIAIYAGRNDEYYPIATVRSEVATMRAAGFPVDLTETDREHGGDTADWEALLPKMASWAAP